MCTFSCDCKMLGHTCFHAHLEGLELLVQGSDKVKACGVWALDSDISVHGGPVARPWPRAGMGLSGLQQVPVIASPRSCSATCLPCGAPCALCVMP